MTNYQQELDIKSSIIKDWQYESKIEIHLTAQSEIKNWQADFFLPYEIKEVYGVNLIDRCEGNYTISNENDSVNLSSGEVVKAVLIVANNEAPAIVPEFTSISSTAAETTNSIEQAEGDSDTAYTEDMNNIAEANDENMINVDEDFGGDLDSAIAAAKDGDVVQLGSNTYSTFGITIDKDITLDGQDGSVIDGGGTSTVINLNSGASGATIQDLEITNGNNGIYGDFAHNLTLQNLKVSNIGIDETIRTTQNNVGIFLKHADGLQLLDTEVSQIGRKGVGINNTDGAVISGLTAQDINLAAQHSQSYDAAGIKFYNTNNVTVKDSYFTDINAFHIWNDTANGTTIDNNTVCNAGEDFFAPDFNSDVDITGIYNEKSSNSVVTNNDASSVGEFVAFRSTEFSTETMILENNNFSSSELYATDFWINESAEKSIATTEDPMTVNFGLIEDEFFAQTNIG